MNQIWIFRKTWNHKQFCKRKINFKSKQETKKETRKQFKRNKKWKQEKEREKWKTKKKVNLETVKRKIKSGKLPKIRYEWFLHYLQKWHGPNASLGRSRNKGNLTHFAVFFVFSFFFSFFINSFFFFLNVIIIFWNI